MKKRTTNILVMMILSMIAPLMATAQTTQKKPSDPPAPSTKQLQPGNGAGFSMEKASADSANAGTNAATTESYWNNGWHTIHPAYCSMYSYGNDRYLIVEAQGGGYFYTTDHYYQTLIEPACQTGNYLQFYVYNNYNFSEVYAYPYK